MASIEEFGLKGAQCEGEKNHWPHLSSLNNEVGLP